MVSVFGKVILSGEHAVVYGKPALVASIDKGVYVRAKRVRSPQHYNKIVEKAREVAGGDEYVSLLIHGDLPVGSGLGSSAVVGAATIMAVRDLLGKPVTDKDELFSLTMECERVAHGNPSGVDPAAVVYGGLIRFIKGEPIKHLHIARPLSFLLVNTGKPIETTREMVELVAANPKAPVVIEQIADVTASIQAGLEKGSDVTTLFDENGKLLELLGVVGKKAKDLSGTLRGMGASVKIVGAGGVGKGSGMMMVLSPDVEKMKNFLDNSKIDYFETTVGGL